MVEETKVWMCPWETVGEDTNGDVKWCSKCGVIRYTDVYLYDSLQIPSYQDETLYCPDRNLIP